MVFSRLLRDRFRDVAIAIAMIPSGCADTERTVPEFESYATIVEAPSPAWNFDGEPIDTAAATPKMDNRIPDREAIREALAKLEEAGITAVPDDTGIRIANPEANFRGNALIESIRKQGNISLTFGRSFERPPIDRQLEHAIRIFPQDRLRSNVEDSIAQSGKIVLRDGCLYAVPEGGPESLAIFPADIGLFRDAEGFAAFRYRYERMERTLPRIGSPAKLKFIEGDNAPEKLLALCGDKSIVRLTGVWMPSDG